VKKGRRGAGNQRRGLDRRDSWPGSPQAKVEAPSTSWLGRLASSRRGSSAAVVVLAVLVYARTASFGFSALDDAEIITDKMAFLSDLSNLGTIFQQPITPLSDGGIYYRPLVSASFMLDAQFAHGEATAFHVTNVVLHAVAAALVLLFLRRLFGNLLGLLGAAVFAVHPALVTVVAWVPGRIEALLAIATLGALMGFIAYLEQRRPRFLAAHLICFLLALLTKETAVVLPVLCIGYVLLLHKEQRPLLRDRALVAGWGACLLVWYAMRAAALPKAVGEPMWSRLGSLFSNAPVLLMHLGKLVAPARLSVVAIAADTPLLPGLLVAAACGFGLYRYRASAGPALYGLGLLAVFLVPTLLASGELILETRLYVPAIGLLCMALAMLENAQVKWQTVAIGAAAVVTLFAAITLSYSGDCKDPMIFSAAAASESPHSALAHMQLGTAFYRAGDAGGGEREYRRAIALDPHRQVVKNNLAVICLNTDRLAEAEQLLNAEIAENPYYTKAYYNLGLVLKKQGRAEEAAAAWRHAIGLEPTHLDALGELFTYYMQHGDSEQAAQYRRLLEQQGVRFQEMPASK